MTYESYNKTLYYHLTCVRLRLYPLVLSSTSLTVISITGYTELNEKLSSVSEYNLFTYNLTILKILKPYTHSSISLILCWVSF